MKHMFFSIIAVLCIGMIACKQTPPETDAPTAPAVDTLAEARKAVVTKFLQSVRDGDIKTAGEQLAENFKGYGPSVKDSSDRAAFIDQWTKRWENEFDSIGYIPYAQLAATVDGHDWVNNWGHIGVKYKNGTPAVHFEYHGAFRLVNGKIVQYIAYYNVADILEQQGYTFVPPARKKPGK